MVSRFLSEETHPMVEDAGGPEARRPWHGRLQLPWGVGQWHQGQGGCQGQRDKEQNPVTKLGRLVKDMKIESLEGTYLLPAHQGI